MDRRYISGVDDRRLISGCCCCGDCDWRCCCRSSCPSLSPSSSFSCYSFPFASPRPSFSRMTAVLAPASCGSPGVARAKRSALAPLGDPPGAGVRSACEKRDEVEKRKGKEQKEEGGMQQPQQQRQPPPPQQQPEMTCFLRAALASYISEVSDVDVIELVMLQTWTMLPLTNRYEVYIKWIYDRHAIDIPSLCIPRPLHRIRTLHGFGPKRLFPLLNSSVSWCLENIL